jgi:hypothetical protein
MIWRLIIPLSVCKASFLDAVCNRRETKHCSGLAAVQTWHPDIRGVWEPKRKALSIQQTAASSRVLGFLKSTMSHSAIMEPGQLYKFIIICYVTRKCTRNMQILLKSAMAESGLKSS